MAPPPKLKRLNVEDFKEAPAWLGRVFDALNPFMTDVTNALSGGIDRQNLRRQVESMVINTRDPIEDTFTNTQFAFRNRLGVRPSEVRIGQVFSNTVSAVDLAGVGLPVWELTQDGLIKVKYIAGLQPSARYDFTFIVE